MGRGPFTTVVRGGLRCANNLPKTTRRLRTTVAATTAAVGNQSIEGGDQVDGGATTVAEGGEAGGAGNDESGNSTGGADVGETTAAVVL
uniref:Uncharacterized protein n=1 Tax=Heliothis virescens TaxID=7102 RepID=A0A2A4J1A7_HELVI